MYPSKWRSTKYDIDCDLDRFLAMIACFAKRYFEHTYFIRWLTDRGSKAEVSQC